MMQNIAGPLPLQMDLKHQRKSLRLMESRRNSQNHQEKKEKKDHPKLLLVVVKDGGSANS
jgi:hypothetical protein